MSWDCGNAPWDGTGTALDEKERWPSSVGHLGCLFWTNSPFWLLLYLLELEMKASLESFNSLQEHC